MQPFQMIPLPNKSMEPHRLGMPPLSETKPARAFTVTELLLIVAVVAILGALFLPGLARSKARSSRINCANCMKQIALAFRTWSLDNADHFPMGVSVSNGGTMELVASGATFPHFQVMSNELSTPRILLCPNDVKRTWATNFTGDLTDKNLSYFVNVDAVNGDGASLLCGDRNLTNVMSAGSRFVEMTPTTALGWTKEIHDRKGNLAFADGRVAAFTNGSAGAATRAMAPGTNRLSVP